MNNKVKNSFKFLVILAVVCMTPLHAKKVLSGTKEMPLEVNLMIDMLQSGSTDNYNKILPTLLNIDLYARSMSKEDIFLIGKIEVYKTLLKNYDTPIKDPINGVSLETLRTAIPKARDNFVKWFLQALLKDAEDLTKNAKYKEFLLQKANNIKMEKADYRKLEKRGELLQYWITKINPNSPDFPDNFIAILSPKILEALKNIQSSFLLMAQETSMSSMGSPLKNETEFKFFTVKEIAIKPPKSGVLAPEQKSVEDILAPITDIVPPLDLPQPSPENWLEEENAPPALQNLPKPSNDADWLQDF